jgi:hypothetical protein
MRTAPTLSLSLLLISCGARVTTANDEPQTPSPEVAQALAVWEQGAKAIPPLVAESPDNELEPPTMNEWTSMGGDPPAEPFHEFDEHVRDFLKSPCVHDAVQFGCSRMVCGTEEWLTAGLDHSDAIVRLRALVALMRVRAPESIIRQWQVLKELQSGPHAEAFATVTCKLQEAFGAEQIASALSRMPPSKP